MVNRLPMGINTLIGELGAQLSGGQIQRILLARALYQRPHILYLDEATSALDKETEQAIISQIKHLGMTQIQIAHRQETIKNAEHHYQINAHGLQRIANR
jgi:ATP-binding cassette subfamily B protein RaxB